MNKEKKKSNFALDFIIAGISAIIGKTSTAPIERVKLLLQNQKLFGNDHIEYKGMIDCFKRVIKSEGYIALWRGNITNCARYFPTQALNFALKDTIREYNKPVDPKVYFWKALLHNCFAGGAAGAISTLLVHPLDLARTRLATDNINTDGKRKYNGSIHCMKHIYQSEGIVGLYRGGVISVITIFLYRAVYFGGYDTLKESLGDVGKANLLIKFVGAQVLSTVCGLWVYPLDTIRRRIMLQSGEAVKIYDNSFDCIRKMYHQEGLIGFYKGYFTSLIRILGSSLVLVLYDEFHKILNLKSRGDVNTNTNN